MPLGYHNHLVGYCTTSRHGHRPRSVRYYLRFDVKENSEENKAVCLVVDYQDCPGTSGVTISRVTVEQPFYALHIYS
jgi:hypothetical protein